MRLVSFTDPADPGILHLGALAGDEVADLSASRPDLPRRLEELLAAGALGELAGAAGGAPRRALGEVQLRAPVTRPPKFLAIGQNYAAHVKETGASLPQFQTWFNKQSTCVIGPGAPIHRPRVSEMLDYEGELGFVIGRRCRHVPAGRAAEVIAGFLVVNDVSVRDWQRRVPTWTMGKSFDTHGPTGPCLVTTDELGDPHHLRLRTWVNGELRQDATTDDLIFNCYDMVEHLTTAFTLEPGDIISTGTPSGVALGMATPKWLRAGDTVRIEIEGIGVLENPVIEEPDTATGLDEPAVAQRSDTPPSTTTT